MDFDLAIGSSPEVNLRRLAHFHKVNHGNFYPIALRLFTLPYLDERRGYRPRYEP